MLKQAKESIGQRREGGRGREGEREGVPGVTWTGLMKVSVLSTVEQVCLDAVGDCTCHTYRFKCVLVLTFVVKSVLQL